MQETWVRSLGGEDPLEKGMAMHSSILAWKIPWRNQVDYSLWGHKESDTTEWLTLSLFTSVWRHPYKTCIVLLCPCILTVYKWSYSVTCLQSTIPWRPIHVPLWKCNSLLSPAVTSYPLAFWRILTSYNPSWTLSYPLKGHSAVGRTWTMVTTHPQLGLPGGWDGKVAACNAGDLGLISGKIPWRRKWQPTPVFLPGKSHG